MKTLFGELHVCIRRVRLEGLEYLQDLEDRHLAAKAMFQAMPRPRRSLGTHRVRAREIDRALGAQRALARVDDALTALTQCETDEHLAARKLVLARHMQALIGSVRSNWRPLPPHVSTLVVGLPISRRMELFLGGSGADFILPGWFDAEPVRRRGGPAGGSAPGTTTILSP